MSFLPPFAHEVQPVMDIINLIIFLILFSTLIWGIFQFRWERKAEIERTIVETRLAQEALARERERDREIALQNEATSRSAFARELYRDYLKTALDNPELSIARYDANDPLSADRYDTFISIMLYAFDEMINGGLDLLKYWTPVIDGQVEVHEQYMRVLFGKEAAGDYGTAYSDLLVDIIRNKLQELDNKN